MKIFLWITSLWNKEAKTNGRDPEVLVIPVDVEPVEASGPRRKKRTTIFVCPKKKASIEEQIRQSNEETDAVHDAAMGTISDFQSQQLRLSTGEFPAPDLSEPQEETAE